MRLKQRLTKNYRLREHDVSNGKLYMFQADTYISQGSVSTRLRYVGILLSLCYTFMPSLSVKEFLQELIRR